MTSWNLEIRSFQKNVFNLKRKILQNYLKNNAVFKVLYIKKCIFVTLIKRSKIDNQQFKI